MIRAQPRAPSHHEPLKRRTAGVCEVQGSQGKAKNSVHRGARDKTGSRKARLKGSKNVSGHHIPGLCATWARFTFEVQGAGVSTLGCHTTPLNSWLAPEVQYTLMADWKQLQTVSPGNRLSTISRDAARWGANGVPWCWILPKHNDNCYCVARWVYEQLRGSCPPHRKAPKSQGLHTSDCHQRLVTC